MDRPPAPPPEPSEPSEPSGGLPPPPAAQMGETWRLDPNPAAIVPGTAQPSQAVGATPRRSMGRVVAIVGAVVLVVAIAGGAAAYLLLRGSTADLLARVPADVEMAAVVQLDPSASQKVNLARLSEAFPGLGGEGGWQARRDELLDEALDGTGLRSADLLEWLGVELAVAVDVVDDDAQVALLADVEDHDALLRTLAKLATPGSPWEGVDFDERIYEGVTIAQAPDTSSIGPLAYATDGDVFVMASDGGLVERIVDTARGDRQSLPANAAFVDAEADLPEGRLAMLYLDAAGLLESIAEIAGTDPSLGSVGGFGDPTAVRGMAMSISAEEGGIAFDVNAVYDPAKVTGALRDQLTAPDLGPEVVAMVPPDAYGVFAVPHVDTGLQSVDEDLRELDPAFAEELQRLAITGPAGFLPHMQGDLVVEMGPDPSTTVGGAVLVEVDAGGEEALDLMMRLIVPDPASWTTGSYSGVGVTTMRGELPLSYAVHENTAIIGSSAAQVRRVVDVTRSGSGIDTAPAFERGMQGMPATDGLLFVDVGGVVRAIRDALPPEEQATFEEELGPDLRAVRSVAMGLESDERHQRVRVFIAVG